MHNPVVGQTPTELKFGDMSLERIGFELNGLNYHHAGPVEEFRASVRLPGDPNSLKKNLTQSYALFLSVPFVLSNGKSYNGSTSNRVTFETMDAQEGS